MPGRSPTKLLGGNQVVVAGERGPSPWSPEAGPEWTGTRVPPRQGLQGLFQGWVTRPAVKVGETQP